MEDLNLKLEIVKSYRIEDVGKLTEIAEKLVSCNHVEPAKCALAGLRNIYLKRGQLEKLHHVLFLMKKIENSNPPTPQPQKQSEYRPSMKEVQKQKRKELYQKMKLARKAYFQRDDVREKLDLYKTKMRIRRRAYNQRMKQGFTSL